MESRIRDLIRHGDYQFQQRAPLNALWQEIAENFYPERADFTRQRVIGRDFADDLDTSVPILARRELANAFAAMLRPRESQWFHIRAAEERRNTIEANRWTEWAEGVMRRAMYDRRAQFTRATAEGDNDYAAFGQPVISVELNQAGDGMLYRCWHLRDVVWSEDVEGDIGHIQRRWNPTIRQLMQVFPKTVSDKVITASKKNPYEKVEVRHIVLGREDYEPPMGKRKPQEDWVSIFIEVDTGKILEETASHSKIYVIPRWQTVSGSQYAFSPAVIAALPDARLIQAISGTLREVAERVSDPPMLATENMVKSPIDLLAGGVTYVEAEYDERLGEVLRPVTQNTTGINYGLELRNDTRAMIIQAFYLDRLNLPPSDGGDMTAFETAQRIQEYIRRALPLFEPMEIEYNGAICEETFEIIKNAGGFGDPEQMPQEIRGAQINFRFESPLHKLIEEAKGTTFVQAGALVTQAVQLEPVAGKVVNATEALRDALTGIGTPATWLRTEDEVATEVEAEKAQAEQAAMVQAATAGAATIKDASIAAKNFADAKAV